MKIYALRDRFLDYYLDPVTQHDDKAALQAVSTHVSGDLNDAIQSAPHHFELWRLGKVENGHVIPEKEFLADVHSLVRARRPATGAKPATPERTAAERRYETQGPTELTAAGNDSPTTKETIQSSGSPIPAANR